MKRPGYLLFPMLAIILMLGRNAFAQGDFSYYFVTPYSNANTAGAPDATLRIINDGDLLRNLWAAIYVFDDSEEMEACCACLITPDGVLSESVNKELTANELTGTKSTRGVIKVIASETSDPTNIIFDPGLHAWMTHIQGTRVTLSPGQPVVPSVTGPFFVTEVPMADSNLSFSEQFGIQNLCLYVGILGSGQGACSCSLEDYDY